MPSPSKPYQFFRVHLRTVFEGTRQGGMFGVVVLLQIKFGANQMPPNLKGFLSLQYFVPQTLAQYCKWKSWPRHGEWGNMIAELMELLLCCGSKTWAEHLPTEISRIKYCIGKYAGDKSLLLTCKKSLSSPSPAVHANIQTDKKKKHCHTHAWIEKRRG